MPALDRELGLADPWSPHHDSSRSPAGPRRDHLVQLGFTAAEVSKPLRQSSLDPELRCLLDLASDDPQSLAPLADIALVGMQHPDDGQDEFAVDPPPAGPETVRDRRPPGLLTD